MILAIYNKWKLIFPIVYMAGIVQLSSVPGTGSPDTSLEAVFRWISPNWQNLLHIPVFAGLTGFWFWALSGFMTSPKCSLFLSSFFTLLFAISDEMHQLHVPGRFASVTDVMADLAGIILAFAWIKCRKARV